MRAGQAFLQAGNVPAARRIAEDRLREDPHDEEALDLLVDCLAEGGTPEQALAVAREWLRREPLSQSAQLAVIFLLLRLREKKPAREAIDRYRACFPDGNVETLDGHFALAFKAYDRARTAYRSTEQARPDDLDRKLALIAVEFGAQRMRAAARLAREVLQAAPDNVLALTRLAHAELSLMRLAGARAHARAALRIDPTATAMRHLIWSSWLIWFPPFLFGHLAVLALLLANETFRVKLAGWLAAVAYLWILGPLFIGFVASINVLGIPNLETLCFLLAIAWILWLGLSPRIASWQGRLKARPVRLAGY